MDMKYEVIIIWNTGEKETYQYKTIEEAKACIYNMRQTFGNQISFTGINDLR